MITPWLILKKTKSSYQRFWKKILLFTSLMTLSSVLIFILYFIRSAYPVDSSTLTWLFWIFLPLLTLNLLFMYVNFIHFLYAPEKARTITQLFANWRWDLIGKTLVLFIIFVAIFSLGFTFPLLILNTLVSLADNMLINILYWLVTAILVGVAIAIFNYLQFAYTLVILRKNDNIKTVLVNSYFLIKKRWWNALFNQIFVILLAGGLFGGLMTLFVRLYPETQIFLIQNDQLKVSSVFLLSYLLVYTILIFLNLNLTLSYNLEFFKLYEKTAKPEDLTK
jgi:MFS family permease